jgi:hypothetical protein
LKDASRGDHRALIKGRLWGTSVPDMPAI